MAAATKKTDGMVDDKVDSTGSGEPDGASDVTAMMKEVMAESLAQIAEMKNQMDSLREANARKDAQLIEILASTQQITANAKIIPGSTKLRIEHGKRKPAPGEMKYEITSQRDPDSQEEIQL